MNLESIAILGQCSSKYWRRSQVFVEESTEIRFFAVFSREAKSLSFLRESGASGYDNSRNYVLPRRCSKIVPFSAFLGATSRTKSQLGHYRILLHPQRAIAMHLQYTGVGIWSGKTWSDCKHSGVRGSVFLLVIGRLQDCVTTHPRQAHHACHAPRQWIIVSCTTRLVTRGWPRELRIWDNWESSQVPQQIENSLSGGQVGFIFVRSPSPIF